MSISVPGDPGLTSDIVGSANGSLTRVGGAAASEGLYHELVFPARPVLTGAAASVNGLTAGSWAIVPVEVNGSGGSVGGRLPRRRKLKPRSSKEGALAVVSGMITEIRMSSSIKRRLLRRRRKMTSTMNKIPANNPPTIPPIRGPLDFELLDKQLEAGIDSVCRCSYPLDCAVVGSGLGITVLLVITLVAPSLPIEI